MAHVIRVWATVVAVEILVGAAAAQEPLADPIETPHVKWAKPYAGGRIRALFVMFYDHQRDAVEMGQRLDLEYDIVTYGAVWSPNATEKDFREKDLARFLKEKDYDVVVSAHYPLWRLSDEVKTLCCCQFR